MSSIPPAGVAYMGIDLGTTFSCVALFVRGQVQVVQNPLGKRTTPSCVSFKNTEMLVGEPAKRNIKFEPTRSFYDCKRLIGRFPDDIAVQDDVRRWRFAVENIDSKPRFRISFRGQEYLLSPADIGAIILRYLKQACEAFLNQPITEVVITVPAYFGNSQRNSTEMAGQIAGLTVTQIVNEPPAAAIAHCFDNNVRNGTLLVFDLGGGTFDVSLVCVSYVVSDDLTYPEVKGSSGHHHLGGQDFTVRIRNLLVREFMQRYPGLDCRGDEQAMESLMVEAEEAKQMLSQQQEYPCRIRALGNEFDYTLTRLEVEEACNDLLIKTIQITEDLLTFLCYPPDQISSIILVGGSTRMPAIKKLLFQHFNRNPIEALNADEDVAGGAAILAASSSNAPGVPHLFLRDVTSLPLGIAVSSEKDDFVFEEVVERFTTLPTIQTVDNLTRPSNRSEVSILVYEGFSLDCLNNTLIGEFSLQNLPVHVDDVPIQVVFDLDINGILKVNVLDIESNIGITEDMQVGNIEFKREDISVHQDMVNSFFDPNQANGSSQTS